MNGKKVFVVKPLCIFLLLTIIFNKGNGQGTILDSLKMQCESSNDLNNQLKTVIEILVRSQSMPADTFAKFISIGKELAVPGSPEHYRIKNAEAMYLMRTANIKDAFNLVDSLLKVIPKTPQYTDSYLWLLNNKVGLLIRTSQSKEAIDEGLKLMEIAEKNNMETWAIRAHVGLGWAHMELEKYNDAIKWLREGIAMCKGKQVPMISGFLTSNIASCYNNIKQRDSAFYYINLALEYGSRDQNMVQMANALNIRADMFSNEKRYKEAEKDLTEALEIRKKIGDNLFVVSDMAQLSSFYASIGETEKGIKLAKQAIPIAENINSLSKLIFIYNALAENYKKAGNGIEYGNTLEKLYELKDSLNRKNSDEAITNLETKYDLQKKENIIIQQENRITRNRYITIGSIVFIVLLSVLIGLFYRNWQLFRMQKIESELIEQKIKAAEQVRMAQEAERKRIAADLHDNLGAYAAAITNNVKGLKEKTVDENIVTQNLEENASNMVTQLSDTIWVLKNEELHFTNLADRFKAWMQRLMKNYPGIKYDFSEKIINDIIFTPANILHLFYILKECVNNALRHSGCSEIKIDFLSDDMLSIIVSDNGSGIKNNRLNGNGIENIKKRAEVCGWNVEWNSYQPQGTQIVLSATTK